MQQHGWIHRDIGPHSILAYKQGGGLIDFELVVRYNPDAGLDHSRTHLTVSIWMCILTRMLMAYA